VLPEASTAAMQVFLDRFAATLAEDEHAAVLLDQAGWHGARDLAVPGNIALVSLPPYSPQLNTVERVWLHLRERHCRGRSNFRPPTRHAPQPPATYNPKARFVVRVWAA